MKIEWSKIVKELSEKAQNLYIECPSCTSPEHCTTILPVTTPINITHLNSCCSCLLNHILDAIPNISRMYIQSKTSDEYTTIYILNNIIIEISEDGALVIPIDKVYEFLEILKELDSESASSIITWLKDEGFKI